MKLKNRVFTIALVILYFCCNAQTPNEQSESKKGFQKDRLFSGGSVSLSFFNNTFLVGASPILGYRLAKWADAGLVVNFNYSSTRDYQGIINAKLRQTTYGGGAFARVFPVNFLFLQGQVEHNFINFKFIPAAGSNLSTQRDSRSVNSLLVGGGYTQGRIPGSNAFFYLSLLFDISGNKNSPYTDYLGRSVPIIRAGMNIPLFGGN